MDDLKRVIAIIAVSVIVAFFVTYYVSCREAGVYNKQYGTDFGCGDFFFAKDQINKQTQTIKLDLD